MPESRSRAKARARRKGFKQSSVVKAKKGGYFIAPHGITSAAGKKTYANCRSRGGSKQKCAKIAWSVEKK